MEDIANPRLLKIKEKTFRYRYSIIHIPGKNQKAADCSSRSPVDQPEDNVPDQEERFCSTVRHFVSGIRVSPTQEEHLEAVARDQLTLGSSSCTLAAMQGHTRLITWERLNFESGQDTEIQQLHRLVTDGLPESILNWPEVLKGYFTMRDKLETVDSAVACGERLVVPSGLRRDMLDILHSGHQGVTGMQARARDTIYWPGIDSDIAKKRQNCSLCDNIAPSLPHAPPTPLPTPEYPFQMVATDYLELGGRSYFVVVDRYSNWPSVYPATTTCGDGSAELVRRMKEYIGTFGVMSEIASDGGRQYTSHIFQEFCKRYQIHHRISSVAFAHSNQKAEGCVKLIKRLVRDNLGRGGNLDTDSLLAALLNFRNTPDRDTGLSPSQIIFGRRLKDYLPIKPGRLQLHPEWRLTMEQRELALAKRHSRRGSELSEHTRTQEPLKIGQCVLIQNQSGNKPLRWDKTGIVVEYMGHHQYSVKTDGSGALTLRNRKFLRPHDPFQKEESTRLTADKQPPPLDTTAAASSKKSEEPPAAVRVSTRTRRAPGWKQDYHCNSLGNWLPAQLGGEHSGAGTSSLKTKTKAFTFPSSKGPGRDKAQEETR